jgi:5-methylcytosine-specific restriction enzyme A
MRPQLATALERLAIVKRRAAGSVPRMTSSYGRGDPIVSAFEGARQKSWQSHIRREWRLRSAKIGDVLARKGKLACEVPGCAFDFAFTYGDIGQDFAQVHHKLPLGNRVKNEKTLLDDLAIVCCNCHAMLHVGGECRSLKGLLGRG